MKLKLLLSLLVLLSLTACGLQSRNIIQPLEVRAHSHNKNGNSVPVSLVFNTPMKAGDELTLRHKGNKIASMTLSGAVKLKILHIRIRALGDGTINARLTRKGKEPLSVNKLVSVGKYSEIPKENTVKFDKKIRIKDGAYKMIILNASAESSYVRSVDINFGHGHALLKGSPYLSPNPYFSFKPVKLGNNTTSVVKLSN